MTAAPVRCERCHRSVWICPGSIDCSTRPDDTSADVPPCPESAHLAALARRPSSLRYRGIEGDLVQLDCARCGARVQISRAVALRASAPIGLVRESRRETPTVEIPNESIAELAAEARQRLGM